MRVHNTSDRHFELKELLEKCYYLDYILRRACRGLQIGGRDLGSTRTTNGLEWVCR